MILKILNFYNNYCINFKIFFKYMKIILKSKILYNFGDKNALRFYFNKLINKNKIKI